MGRVQVVPCLCELYTGICRTTEEKAQKNLSQGIHSIYTFMYSIHTFLYNILIYL